MVLGRKIKFDLYIELTSSILNIVDLYIELTSSILNIVDDPHSKNLREKWLKAIIFV